MIEPVYGFELSPQQKRLWLLQGNDFSYRAQTAVLLEGELENDSLRAALDKIVKRHEILRTSFRRISEIKFPVQVIVDAESILRITDLTDLAPQEQQNIIDTYFSEELHQAFDFERGNPPHFTLLTLSDHKHVLLVSLPALCADTWTLKNLVRELSYYYKTPLGEEVPDEFLQYADYAGLQNEESEEQNFIRGRAYWQKQNLSHLSAFALPFEKRFQELAGFESKTISYNIDPDLVTKITNYLLKFDISPTIFFLGCWQTLIWRLTSQSDVMVGTHFDGREHDILRNSFGLYAKWLPISCHFEQCFRIDEIWHQVKQTISDALEWESYYLPEYDGNPINNNGLGLSFFPFGFEFEQPLQNLTTNDMSFSPYRQYCCYERFKVKLHVFQESNTFRLEFHYDPNLFQSEQIERTASHFQTLLGNIINDNDCETEIGQLNLLSKIEINRLLFEFNDSKTGYSTDSCIQQLFEDQAERTPDNLAVIYGNVYLTYRELNNCSNQLAHYLRELGVNRGSTVGLSVERSSEMIIGLMGILKAGGAYVPLNPAHPKARLDHQLTETQAQVLVTQENLLSRLPEFRGAVCLLDPNQRWQEQQSTVNPKCLNSPEDLAYVIYTSGTTGVPKGVGTLHRNLVNYSEDIGRKIGADKKSLHFANVASLTADLGNTAIFPPLIFGGVIHVIRDDVTMDAALFSQYTVKHSIDVLKIAPSHISALLASPDGPKILPRQILIVGGEPLSWDLVQRVKQMGTCDIMNHYAPTETTIGSLVFIVGDVTRSTLGSTTVPMGKPIANTEVYILDEHMNPVPIEVPGELYIGGAGLSRGYINQPALTHERFVPNPFKDIPLNLVGCDRGRVYRSGDIARYLPDGNIESLGRIDHQVKIRGFRVELVEIETVLRQHPSVQNAVVMLREDVPGDKRLVAYIVANQGFTPSLGELRNFLQEKLPDYMVPSAFVLLDTIPLTPNGKADRRALPMPDSANQNMEKPFFDPTSSLEEVIAGVYAETLNLEQVSIHDDFFELGGHSLLATQLISRLRSIFDIELPVRSLFESPTVAGLAEKMLHNSDRGGNLEETAQLLLTLDKLSDDEVNEMIQKRTSLDE